MLAEDVMGCVAGDPSASPKQEPDARGAPSGLTECHLNPVATKPKHRDPADTRRRNTLALWFRSEKAKKKMDRAFTLKNTFIYVVFF